MFPLRSLQRLVVFLSRFQVSLRSSPPQNILVLERVGTSPCLLSSGSEFLLYSGTQWGRWRLSNASPP